MVRGAVEKRLRELGLYSEFYHRKELKALGQVLQDGEQLNCVLTGVHEANRKMVAVTDRRILIVFTAIGSGSIKAIRRDAVKEYRFDRKLLLSSLTITTRGGEVFTFTNTQGSVKDIFDWAMARPLPGSDPA